MKKYILLSIGLLFFIFNSAAQSYLATTIRNTILYNGAGISYDTIKALEYNSQVFVISTSAVNGFYNVIDIENNSEGFVKKSDLKLGEKIQVFEGGLFTPVGETKAQNPEIEVLNNTSLDLLLKLEKDTFSFSPQQKRKISILPGNCNIRASAPGVIPFLGKEELKENISYYWEFYVVVR